MPPEPQNPTPAVPPTPPAPVAPPPPQPVPPPTSNGGRNLFSSFGPTLGLIILAAAVIIGGLYLWGSRL